MIVASIPGPTVDEALAQIEAARRAGADIAELRLDLFQDPDPAPFLAKKTLPLLVTLRPAWEGGKWSGSEDDRIAILRDAGLGGADYIDIEFKAYKDFDRGTAKLVLSYHDFEKTPANLEAMARKMETMGPDLVKIAVLARSTADVIAAVSLQKRMERPSAVIPMGDFGEPVRILYRRYGGFLTYAAVDEAHATAPGQLTVAGLVHDYRVKAVDDETRVYAVVGNPVGHSQSPRLFNRVFHDLGVNARYVKVRLDDATKFREAVSALEIRGMSVTIPHKEAAVAMIDAPDEFVTAIGAVNTVVDTDGRLEGHNTDVLGAIETMKDAAMRKWHHGLYGLKALVLGAGGVARAIAWGLKQEGAKVVIAGRTFERAKALADVLRCDYLAWGRLDEARAQVVANGTSVGMRSEESPFPAALWKRDMLAFDAVYTPRYTRFLRDAKAAGAEPADGVEMFLRQATHQLKHYIGRGIPTEITKEFYQLLS